jgi:hypothetical protein
LESIPLFKEGKCSYIVFESDIGAADKAVCDIYYDGEEAFVLSKAAEILRRDILQKEKRGIRK